MDRRFICNKCLWLVVKCDSKNSKSSATWHTDFVWVEIVNVAQFSRRLGRVHFDSLNFCIDFDWRNLFFFLFFFIYLKFIPKVLHIITTDALYSQTRFYKGRQNITKTRLFKYIENFTSKIWKFSEKKLGYFSNFCSKHTLWYSLEPPRRGGSNEYSQSMFWAEIRQITYTPVNPSFTI